MGDGMNGWELTAAIKRIAPNLPVVLATGWGAGISEEEALTRGVSAVVGKPYRREDIRAVIARARSG
jgi:CheY-like chemotaxis protein